MHSTELKVLMIMGDRQILSPDSSVRERISYYGNDVEELHIVLMCDKSHGLKEEKIAPNIWVYPTNSFSKYLRAVDGARLGKRIVFDKKFVRGKSLITTQDPFEHGWAGLKIKKKWRLPLEVQLHTDPFSENFSGFINKRRKKIAKKVISKADQIRVVTESLREDIASMTDADVYVLPIYIDRSKIESRKVSFDLRARYGWQFTLLTVARLEPEKNIALAIKALGLVRQDFPDVGLVIVGRGGEESNLKKLAESLDLKNHVVFVGWQEELASYYRTASAYLQTSYFEGYGLSLVEAGLSGLPVISTPVGVVGELEARKDLYVCDFDDVQCFRDSVVDLIEHNQNRNLLKNSLKTTLESKLLSKEEYLQRLQDNWVKTAGMVKTNL